MGRLGRRARRPQEAITLSAAPLARVTGPPAMNGAVRPTPGVLDGAARPLPSSSAPARRWKTSQPARLRSAGSILRAESRTMTTSSEKAGLGRRVSRYDTWIMVTGVVMFLLSFAPWEGLNPETRQSRRPWQSRRPRQCPCHPGFDLQRLACGLRGLAAVLGCSRHRRCGRHARLLRRAGSGSRRGPATLPAPGGGSGKHAVLSIRAISLFVQHNPNVGQARWGVYLAFIVGVMQFGFVIRGRKKIGQVTASASLSGSPGPGRASNFCRECGTRAAAGDNFCQQCGAPVKTEQEAIREAVPHATEAAGSIQASTDEMRMS